MCSGYGSGPVSLQKKVLWKVKLLRSLKQPLYVRVFLSVSCILLLMRVIPVEEATEKVQSIQVSTKNKSLRIVHG